MPPLTPGTVILDRYRIVAFPTQDGVRGLVAPALDQRLGRRVDLVLAPAPAGTPMGDLFMRRAHALVVLRHAALPLVMDMGLHERHVVLAYRPAEGRSLADLAVWRTERWTERRVLQTVADLAAALGLAHAHGLCHGSFSVRSVLVDRDGTVAILDLIWPRPATELHRGAVAPEVLHGAAPTPRADVYALGQVLRQLMRLSDPEAVRATNGATKEIARRASARAPRERYADGAALARAIGRLLAQPPVPRASAYITPPTMARHGHVTTTAASQHHPRPAAQRRASAIVPVALAFSLAVGLLPLASIVAHETMDHRPFVGFPLRGDGEGWRPGWRAWSQPPPWPQWRHHDSDQPWPP